jgi:hypothetical protein
VGEYDDDDDDDDDDDGDDDNYDEEMTTTPGLLMNDYEHDGNMSPLGATAYAV